MTKTETAAERYYKTKGVITPIKNKDVISKTRRAPKKIQKTKVSTKLLKQRKAEITAKKEAALKKFLAWSPEKRQTTLKVFEDSVRAGKSNSQIAAKLKIKDMNEFKWWIEHEYAKQDRYIPLKDVRKSIISKAGTPTEKWSEFRESVGNFEERLRLGFCPIVSTGDRSVYSRKYPLVPEGQTFSKELEIIPDISVQPIKRLRIAAHSYTTAGEWKDGEKLKDLTVAFCENETDKYMTHEGGIIISKALSELEGLNKGDKLLSLNGLKGIVCEVRSMNTDLLINKEQVWGSKSSKKCGGAVLEIQATGKLSCFYQKAHTIQQKIYRDTEGVVVGSGTFSPPARFSPDLVPFLFHHLGFRTLLSLTTKNRERIHDYLRFLNADFVVKDNQLVFVPKKTSPEAHKGGTLIKFDGYLYSRRKWEEHLSKTSVELYDLPYYPFYPKRLWLPHWFDYEELLEYEDKDGIFHKTTLAKFIGHETGFRTNMSTRYLMKLLYKTIYGRIENSIGYLIAVPTATEPKVLILNRTDCIERDINEGDKVLVWRPPVVSARLPNVPYSEKTKHSNIFKLTVKYGARQKTAEINVATMRLMFGDFDGDSLYVMKIPEGTAKDLEPAEELEKEENIVRNEIKEIDAVKLPKSRRDVLLSMRNSFIDEEIKKGYVTAESAKNTRAELLKTPTKKLRGNAVLLHEAAINHNEAIVESRKITEIGGLTKWGWMAAKKDEIPELITATQSIEIMKDRPKRDDEGYKADKKYLLALKQRLSKSELNYGYTQFTKFCSRSAYGFGIAQRRKAPTYGGFADKALTPSYSIIGRWILLLTS